MSWIKSHLLSSPVGLGAAASTNASAAPCHHPAHSSCSIGALDPGQFFIGLGVLAASKGGSVGTACLREQRVLLSHKVSSLQWKRFKYFGNHTSQQFSPKAHKSLMGIQSQIIPGGSGCDADLHIKRGRTMWKREFQLILITCQVEYKSFSFERSGGCRGSM